MIADSSSAGPSPDSEFASHFVVKPRTPPPEDHWGRCSVVLEIASLSLRLSGLNRSQHRTIRGLYAMKDPDQSGREQVEIAVNALSPGDFNLFDRSTWVYDMDFDHRSDSVWVASWGFLGMIRLEPNIDGAVWTCFDRGDEFHAVLENFLRVVIAYRLLAQGGLLLHSSGILIDGAAHLFVGPSGAGKSTICGLSRDEGLEVLSDDLNAIIATGQGAKVEKLPFSGEPRFRSKSRGQYPIGGIYRIRKADVSSLTHVSPARPFATLVQNAPFVNRNPYTVDALLEVIGRLTDAFPLRELAFRRDTSFLALLGEPA